MYAGGISYLSSCSFGFIGCVSAEAVVIDTIEAIKIERGLADIVENFIRCEGWSIEVVKRTRFLISDSSSRIAALAPFSNPEQ